MQRREEREKSAGKVAIILRYNNTGIEHYMLRTGSDAHRECHTVSAKAVAGSAGVVPSLALSQAPHGELRVAAGAHDGGTRRPQSLSSSRPDDARRRKGGVITAEGEGVATLQLPDGRLSCFNRWRI